MKNLLKVFFICVFVMGILLSCKDKGGNILPAEGPQNSKNAVVFLGDSITEGYGLSAGQDYPSLIQKYWDKNNIAFRSINAGISGDTTNDIINRLDDVLTDDTCFVLLEIGANDAFSGAPTDEIKKRLIQIIKSIQRKNTKVALMAMEIPDGTPGRSSNYIKNFAKIYNTVGKELKIPVMPSLLEYAYQKDGLMQSDGIHPSAAGQKVLAKNILKFLNKEWVMK